MPASRHQQRYSRVDSPHGRRTFHQRDARESWTLGLTTRSSRAGGRAADLTLAEAWYCRVTPVTQHHADPTDDHAIVLMAATGAPDTIALPAVVLGWLGLSVGPIGGGLAAATSTARSHERCSHPAARPFGDRHVADPWRQLPCRRIAHTDIDPAPAPPQGHFTSSVRTSSVRTDLERVASPARPGSCRRSSRLPANGTSGAATFHRAGQHVADWRVRARPGA
jgi:hypothetical protein